MRKNDEDNVLVSMTGFGRAEVTNEGITAAVEVRGVNSRFLEVTSRLPKSLSTRETEVKEIVRSYINRGKVTVNVTLRTAEHNGVPLSINVEAARAYYNLLNQLRKAVKLRERVKLEHLLHFSDVLEVTEESEAGEREWTVVREALRQALDEFNAMRKSEGEELAKDFQQRIAWMEETIARIEQLSRDRIPEERKRLRERVAQLLDDKRIIDQNRLELEIALLSDKLDVTEECVRYRSHNKFFLEAMHNGESAGRKLNFLVQEMNREANTIGSKASDATLSHLVVQLKEELEKIREQLQNIE